MAEIRQEAGGLDVAEKVGHSEWGAEWLGHQSLSHLLPCVIQARQAPTTSPTSPSSNRRLLPLFHQGPTALTNFGPGPLKGFPLRAS